MTDHTYVQGDIVWASYPLTDKIDKYKKRPVLVSSNEISNDLANDYIVLPITRAIRSEPFSVLIEPANVDGNLPVSSELRCNKPFTVRQSLLLEKIGELATEKVQAASAYMCQSIHVS